MAKHPKRPRDPNHLAKLIVDMSTGEAPNNFGANVDYAMLVKMYEGDSGKNAPAERRYSRRSARAPGRNGSRAIRTLPTSPRASWSARTSRCA